MSIPQIPSLSPFPTLSHFVWFAASHSLSSGNKQSKRSIFHSYIHRYLPLEFEIWVPVSLFFKLSHWTEWRESIIIWERHTIHPGACLLYLVSILPILPRHTVKSLQCPVKRLDTLSLVQFFIFLFGSLHIKLSSRYQQVDEISLFRHHALAITTFPFSRTNISFSLYVYGNLSRENYWFPVGITPELSQLRLFTGFSDRVGVRQIGRERFPLTTSAC